MPRAHIHDSNHAPWRISFVSHMDNFQNGDLAKIVSQYVPEVKQHNDHFSNLVERYSLVYGLVNGINVSTSTDGHLTRIREFVNGLIHGTMTEYDDNENLLCRTQYVYGKKHGIQKHWTRNGLCIKVLTFADDVLHGPFEQRWPTIQAFNTLPYSGCCSRGTYMNGKLHGIERTYLIELNSQRAAPKEHLYIHRTWLNGLKHGFETWYRDPDVDPVARPTNVEKVILWNHGRRVHNKYETRAVTRIKDSMKTSPSQCSERFVQCSFQSYDA